MFGAKYSRLKFWIIWSVVNIPLAIISTLSDIIERSSNGDDNIIFISLITLVLLIIAINTLANRIRDYGSNPWLALLVLIPLVGMIIVLYYGIAKHKKDDTKTVNSQKQNNSSSNSSLTKAVINHSKEVACSVKPKVNEYIEKHSEIQCSESDNKSNTSNTEEKQNIEIVEQLDTLDDNDFYAQAMDELENDTKDKGLWAKAYANSDGNNEKAKALYIQYRVETMRIEKKKLKWNKYKIDNEKGRLVASLKDILKEYGYYQFGKTTVYKKHSDNYIVLEVILDEDRELVCIIDDNNHEVETIKI